MKDVNTTHYYKRTPDGRVATKHKSVRLPYEKAADTDSRIMLDKEKIKLLDSVKFIKESYSRYKPKIHLKATRQRTTVIIVATTFVGVGLIVSNIDTFIQNQSSSDVKGVQSDNGSITTPIVENAKPEYSVLSPAGAGLESKGGLIKISPTNEKPVYTFKDTIEGSEVVINQQSMPRVEGKSSEEVLANMVTQLKAEKVIEAGNTKAYLAQADYGPQQIIFNKANLLIQITSDRKIEDSTWIEYIGNLKF